ncbi:MAG: hypothetical protein COA80_07705 [Leeuwenhoekiella sp.]|nr:MAG: hypothetical protein COA80_07705 [Leeuwenhoekiella sp.]
MSEIRPNDFRHLDKDRDIYKQIFQYSVIPILVHDMEMRILNANDSAIELFGFKREELLNKNISELHTEDQLQHSTRVLDKMRQETRLSVETSFKRKDGSIFMAEATPCKYILDQEPVIHVFIQDITERKQAEKQLLESSLALEAEVAKVKMYAKEIELKNKELEDFSYVAAHDLKAPVTNLSILSDMVTAEMTPEQHKSPVFKNLRKNIGQIHKKVFALNDVLNFKATLDYEHEELVFQDVFEEVTMGISEQFKNEIVEIETDFSKCPQITYPKIHLKSILQNLLTNAIKFKDPDRKLKIQLKTSSDNDQACLVVKDNGLGFEASKYKDKIFKLFKRLHVHVDGMGVGMYIVKSIIDSHGGEIDVKSKPQEGTEFIIYLNNASL